MSTQPERSTRFPLVTWPKLGQLPPETLTQLGITFWLIVGIGLRFWYWTANLSVWHDEAALIVNVLDLSYLEMFGPLKLDIPAPPLFLVLERAVYQAFGEHQLALRFVSWSSSCLALIFFADVCVRLLDRRGALWAVALLAVSDRLLWHAHETKAYSTDLFVAVMALWLWVQTRESTLLRRCLVGLLFFPVVQWFSFPSCFLAGMWLLVLAPSILKSKRILDWGAYLTLAVLIGVSFLTLLWGPIESQRSAAMDSCWTHQFPNWQKPYLVPFWCVTQTLELLRYLLMPTGQLFLGVAIVGGVLLARRKEYQFLSVCVSPVALGLIACLIKKYPYGGARVCLFMMPGILLLVGAGIPSTMAWAKRKSIYLFLVGWLVLAIPFGYAAYRMVKPWPREDHANACHYIAKNMHSDELICSSHWETLYYLRNHPTRRDGWPDLSKESPNSFWILTTMPAKEYQTNTERYANEYRIIEEKKFQMVTVVRFQRK